MSRLILDMGGLVAVERSNKGLICSVLCAPNYPSRRWDIQRSANLHENALCRITAEEAVFDSVGIIKSLAWRTSISESAALKYAGVSAETMLRLEGPAPHLSISCLHLAIVDLLSVILDRCDSGIPKIQSFAGLEYIYACAA